MRVTSEMDTPRHFDRGSWIAVGVVLAFLLQCLAGSAAQLTIANDGCLIDMTTIETPVVQTCIGGWVTPLSPGDTLERVAGQPVTSDPTQVGKTTPPSGWGDGGIVRYRVQRAGQTLELDVPLHSWSPGELARGFWFMLRTYANDLVLLLCVAVIFGLRPGSRAAQLLLVAFAANAIHDLFFWPVESTTSGASFVSSPLAWFPGNLPGTYYGWLLVAPLLLLVLSFPRQVWPVSRWPRLAPGLIFGVAFGATLMSFLVGNFLIYLVQLGLYAALVVITFVATTIYTLLRVRDPVVRAQTAWLGLGMAGFCVNVLGWIAINIVPEFDAGISQHPILLGLPFDILGTIALPLCLGIAITRYRLFDIEVIIRRTLIYSTLTLVLGLLYLGCILLSRILVAPLIGGSELAIVVSTLAIAALFNPLRHRIQNIIDKRFYRRKYDAAKVLAAFGILARDETNLDALMSELVRVVDGTMQPEFVGLWLREQEPGVQA